MSPENRRCPKCGNPTLVFMNHAQTWQCISTLSTHLSDTNATVVPNIEVPCGYSEQYDSLTAILRGMVFYLTEIVNSGIEDDSVKRLAKSRDEIEDVLADKDTINLWGNELEKDRR